MYEKMMERIMGENVSLADWKEFRNFYESLPRLSLNVTPSKLLI